MRLRLALAARRWSLTLHEPYDSDGTTAWVAPVTRSDGSPAVLKLGLPHMEAEHEIAGLRFWNGRAMVRLLDSDEELNAMLLEPCVPGSTLRTLAEDEQDTVIAELLPQLWLEPPPAPFRPLSEMLNSWIECTLETSDLWPDVSLVQAGLDLLAELPGTSDPHVMLLTDLHAGNVLAAQRAPWLAIDPKPFVGDRTYDATQHLVNCTQRMLADPQRTIARFASALNLDCQRLRLWMFARAAAQPRRRWRGDPWFEIARRIAP